MKTAIIFFHGNLSDTSYLKKYLSKKPWIICADGGADLALDENVTPDVVVGDCDSISIESRQELEKRGVKFITYPREKDFTDAELAVQHAIDHGFLRIIIVGLLGDRLDHMMANIFFLARISQAIDICILEKDQEIRFVDTSMQIYGHKGDEVSLIPVQSDCKGISTKGLRYSLLDADLLAGSTRGISNVMLSSQAKVSLKQGVLMVVHRRLKD